MLVDKIENGDIQLPEMQRQYVWKPPRVRDLLDSLYREYPSGMILMWEPDGEVVTRGLPEGQNVSQRPRVQLLLDGQQRLTSLYAVLTGKPVKKSARSEEKIIDILFNLKHPNESGKIPGVDEGRKGEDDTGPNGSNMDVAKKDVLKKKFEHMAFVVRSKTLAKMSHWVSVTEVLKDKNPRITLEKADIAKEDRHYDLFFDRLVQLGKIPDYEYQVRILESNKSYEEVMKIFNRVNSRGANLRGADLALAQITAKWRGVWKIFENFSKECEKRGFDLEQAIHLKNLAAFAQPGQSSYKSIGRLSGKELESKWEEAKEGMNYALGFLCENAEIDSLALLSNPYILITVAAYAHSKNYDLSPKESSQLSYWILAANAKARYSRGASESLLDQDLATIHRKQGIEDLLRTLKTQFGRLDISLGELEKSNTRTPYFKTMFMAFKKNKAKDWQTQHGISLKKSGTSHSLQFHHIFPRSVLRKKGLASKKINDICNLAFISARTNRRISNQEPADYLPQIKDKIGSDGLAKQCIPDDSSLWEVDEYETFLSERRKLIVKGLNEFLGHDRWQEGNLD